MIQLGCEKLIPTKATWLGLIRLAVEASIEPYQTSPSILRYSSLMFDKAFSTVVHPLPGRPRIINISPSRIVPVRRCRMGRDGISFRENQVTGLASDFRRRRVSGTSDICWRWFQVSVMESLVTFMCRKQTPTPAPMTDNSLNMMPPNRSDSLVVWRLRKLATS